jgi:hypothetical protein
MINIMAFIALLGFVGVISLIAIIWGLNEMRKQEKHKAKA